MCTPTNALVHDPPRSEAVELSPSQLFTHTLRPSNLGPIVFTLRECFMQESSVVNTVRSPELQCEIPRGSRPCQSHCSREWLFECHCIHQPVRNLVRTFATPKQIRVVSNFFLPQPLLRQHGRTTPQCFPSFRCSQVQFASLPLTPDSFSPVSQPRCRNATRTWIEPGSNKSALSPLKLHLVFTKLELTTGLQIRKILSTNFAKRCFHVLNAPVSSHHDSTRTALSGSSSPVFRRGSSGT